MRSEEGVYSEKSAFYCCVRKHHALLEECQEDDADFGENEEEAVCCG